MQRRTSFALLAFCTFSFTAIAPACSSDETAADDDTTTSSSSGSSGVTSSSSGATSSSSGSTSSSSGGRDAGVKPADCEAFTLGEVPLQSPAQLRFDTAAPTALVRTASGALTQLGDAALPDRLDVYLHGTIGAGTHAMDPDPNKLFVRTTGDADDNYMQTCETCAQLRLDYSEPDGGSGSYAANFAAVAGRIEITEALTPHQTHGTVRQLELREMQRDETTKFWSVKPGGRCLWLEEASYDTRLEGGCKPFTGSCPNGGYCMPLNSIGTDGKCVSVGSKTVGQACTRASEQSWDSDCASGLRCLGADGESPTCHTVCDQLAETNPCPAGTTCGGGYNICLDNEDVLSGSGFDLAAIGEECTETTGDGQGWAMYCGGTGKRRGTCVDPDGMAGPIAPTCQPLLASVVDVPEGKAMGYLAYKNGIDQSTGWSFTLPFVR